MTCIRFFSHKAKSYTELGEKLSWLLKAKDHLKIYLQENSRSSGRKKTTFFRKKMAAADVSRYWMPLRWSVQVGSWGWKGISPGWQSLLQPGKLPRCLKGGNSDHVLQPDWAPHSVQWGGEKVPCNVSILLFLPWHTSATGQPSLQDPQPKCFLLLCLSAPLFRTYSLK